MTRGSGDGPSGGCQGGPRGGEAPREGAAPGGGVAREGAAPGGGASWEGWCLAADYHTHTRFSHGRGSIAENVEAAARAGLAELGICDHGPALLFIGLRSEDRLAEMRRQVEEAQVSHPSLRVLLGVEANVVSPEGDLDISDAAVSALDILLVGLHPQIRPSLWQGAWPLVWKNALARVAGRLGLGGRVAADAGGAGDAAGAGALVEGDARAAGRGPEAGVLAEARRINTRALVRAVERYPVLAVTHAGLKMDVDMEELARACARRGTAIEINSLHGYPREADLAVALRCGARFIISSDAHDPARVGCLRAGLERARRAGIHPHLVLNARRGAAAQPAEAGVGAAVCAVRGAPARAPAEDR